LSGPGVLAKQIYKTLGGHVLMLNNEKLLSLLEHMNGGKVPRNGQPTEEKEINQPRELPIDAIRKDLSNPSTRNNLCDYLISKGVFHVGLRLQCPNCARNSWYPVEQMDTSFKCPLCLTVFPAIGNIENGQWRYKTTGPFSVPGFADGAYATLLALEFFADRKLTSIESTRALSFTATRQDGKTIEADFAVFWQDRMFGENIDGVAFGECKTYGQFQKKDFDRMRFLAKTFPGSVIAFCTLRKKITSREIKAITRIAKRGRKHWKNDRPVNPVLILTANEILSFGPPPYCWEESLRNKFNHVSGLLNICDATQQIYLNLPSWKTEWHKKSEDRRRKLDAKLNKKKGNSQGGAVPKPDSPI
jgi:hypothetical protein